MVVVQRIPHEIQHNCIHAGQDPEFHIGTFLCPALIIFEPELCHCGLFLAVLGHYDLGLKSGAVVLKKYTFGVMLAMPSETLSRK